MSTLRVNTLQDATGSNQPAMAGAAKAWVNFDGTGTVAIREQFNVSSITDIGTGQYQVNLTNPMPDTSFCAMGSTLGTLNAAYATFLNGDNTAYTTSMVAIEVRNVNSSLYDQDVINVAIFR